MKHCIEIDMSITTKNVNFRLYESKLHVVGVSNHDMIKEIVFLLNKHITKIQQSLNYFKENPSLIDEYLELCKGERINRPGSTYKYTQLLVPKFPWNLKQSDPEFQGNLPNSKTLQNPAFEIYTAPFYLHEPVDNWKEYVKFVYYINSLKELYTGSITLSSIHDVVANYCYNLGFTINRSALHKLVKNNSDFYSEYDKSKKKEVILSLSIDEDKLQDRPFKESDREPCHTFTIKRKGNITQKGPSQILCCEAYDIFCKLIWKLRSEIKKD